jgi:hypothetical protein
VTDTPLRLAALLGAVAVLVAVPATASRAAIRDERPPDVRDAAAPSRPLNPSASGKTSTNAANGVRADGRRAPRPDHVSRSPTTRQVLVVVPRPVFDWTDAAIGAVAGFAIALILCGVVLASSRGRRGGFAA